MNELLKALLEKTSIIGVIACGEDLEVALTNHDIADIYEWRADRDSSPAMIDGVRQLYDTYRKPVILTVRDAREEASHPTPLRPDKRRSLYHRNMGIATLIDVEASTAQEMASIIKEAQRKGVGVIISQHITSGGWHPDTTHQAIETHLKFKGDIFKVALLPKSFEEFSGFVATVSYIRARGVRIAPMAMGKTFGKVSRLLFGSTGSPLVYGYLSRAVVGGQWHVSELRDMLARVAS